MGQSAEADFNNQLAKLLRRFNVSPRTIKLPNGSTAKGYHREMFNEHLPLPAEIPLFRNVTP